MLRDEEINLAEKQGAFDKNKIIAILEGWTPGSRFNVD